MSISNETTQPNFSWASIPVWTIQRIPLRALRRIGRWGGLATYHLSGSRRRVALENLDLAYGDSLTPEEKIQIAKESFVNLVTTGLEFCYSPAIKRPIDELVHVENPEVFFEAHKKGKGIIVLVPHMGNWEVCGRWYGEKGIVQHAVVRQQKQAWVNRMVSKIRKTNGIIEIDKRNAIRKVLAALHKGEMVSMLIDQHAQKESVSVEFFGQPAMTHASVARLALRTGCEVIVCSGFRYPDGSFGGVFSDPIETVSTGDRERDILENTQRYVSVIEEYVRKNPQDWMWMHRRWKPPKEPVTE
ncbi:MAG: lysophospholipid acyltransferase family protein [Candidatus Omnitrophica bacterium]|nr:lysophospholipid acyltransferase family protein [Candidatus Omnitrophota bacterium]MCA9425853.1 lysophospholipid acyltransferase family protein [Candidatus Omnitrophota bacterium]